MIARLLFIIVVVTFLLGCSNKSINQANINHLNLDTNKNYIIKYARKINYDRATNNLSYEKLNSERPKNGNFKILYFEKNLLKMSFDISVKDTNKFDLLKPVQNIGYYSYKGFEVGANMLQGTNVGTSNDAMALLSIPIITTIGGFMVGVVTSLPSIAKELKDLIIVSKKEFLNYNTIYLYDKQNKLTHKLKG